MNENSDCDLTNEIETIWKAGIRIGEDVEAAKIILNCFKNKAVSAFQAGEAMMAIMRVMHYGGWQDEVFNALTSAVTKENSSSLVIEIGEALIATQKPRDRVDYWEATAVASRLLAIDNLHPDFRRAIYDSVGSDDYQNSWCLINVL